MITNNQPKSEKIRVYKKPIISVLIAILLVGGFAAYRSSHQLKPGLAPLEIGFIGPLSGSSALWGEGARNMVQLAVEEVNASGGIKGRELIVNYQDGKCTGADAVNAYAALRQQQVKFILGGHCSPETTAIAPLTKDGSAFILAGITVANKIVDGSDYAYRTSPGNLIFAEVFAPAMAKKYTSVATLTQQTPFAKSFTDDFVNEYRKAGGTVTKQIEFSDQTDFRSDILNLKNSNPAAILISPQMPAAAVAIAKQLQEAGVTIPLIGNSIFVGKTVYTQAGNPTVMHGATSIVPYTDRAQKTSAELVEKYKSRYGSDVPYNDFYVMATYDGAKMLAQGLEKYGEDVSKVADYFLQLSYEGVSGDFQFKANGDSTFKTFAEISITDQGELQAKPL